MRTVIALVTIHLLALAQSPQALAATRQKRSVRTSAPPRIDGDLGDPGWRQAEPIEQMVQSFPDPGRPASYSTRIRVLHDDRALYISAHCEDPMPERIVARVTRRDRWIESDWFQVDIDSRHDLRTGFFFAVNPAGVQVDGTLFNENQESTDWDGVWEAETRIVGDGWDVEIRIPLHLLRFTASDDVHFGINFTRRISRLNEANQWQLIAPETSSRVSRFGVLNNLDLPSRPTHFEVAPYLAGRLDVEGAALSDDMSRALDAGVDGKLGLGSNFMLTWTANPDFGQVEIDQVVLNLSTIETYFPEKRPFFLEDQALFQMPQFGDGGPRAELFYTRRIGQAAKQPDLEDEEEMVREARAPRIYGAAKLAGTTEGRLSVGLLQAVTSEERARIRAADGREFRRTAEPLTSYSVLRLDQGFGDNSAVGLMATAAASPDSGAAVTGGTNLQLELFNGSYNLTALTHFSYLTEERFSRHDDFTRAALEDDGPFGYGGELVLWKKSGEHLVGAVGGSYRSRSLALNDVGYLDRPDQVFAFGWLQFRRLKPIGPLARLQVNANAWTIRNTALTNIGQGGNINGHAVFTNNMFIGSYFAFQPARCDDRETRTAGRVVVCGLTERFRFGSWASTDQRKMISAGLEFHFRNTDRGQNFSASLPVQINPASRLQLELIPRYQRENGSLRWIDTEEGDDVERFVFGEQHSELWDLTLRSTLTFHTEMTLQAYAQVFLAAVDYTRKYAFAPGDAARFRLADLVRVDDVADEYDFTAANLNLGVVLRWEYRPGSLAYLVYTGAFGHDGEAAEFRFGRNFDRLFDETANHTLMLKLSYWWG